MLEGAGKALFVLEADRLGELLEGAVAAVEELDGAVAAGLVLELLQRSAFFEQLPVQGARRYVQPGGQPLGGGGFVRVGVQQLAHPLHQQPVATVLQHGQRQRALQHALQRALVAPQGQRKVAHIEADRRTLGLEAHWPGEHQRVHIAVRRRCERKARLQQRNP